MMDKSVLNAIPQLRINGKKPTEIAALLGISVNTVKSHIRRHPQTSVTVYCPNCGAVVPQNPGRKTKKFCSDKCRMTWWNHTYRSGEKR